MTTSEEAQAAHAQLEERLTWLVRRARESMEPETVSRLTDQLEGIIGQHPVSRLGSIEEFDTADLAGHWNRVANRLSLWKAVRSLADVARQTGNKPLWERLAELEKGFAQDLRAVEFIDTHEKTWEDRKSRTIYGICEDAGLSPMVVSLIPEERLEECELMLNDNGGPAHVLSAIGSTIFDEWWDRFHDRYFLEPRADGLLEESIAVFRKDFIRFSSLLRAYPVAEHDPDRLEPFAALDRMAEQGEEDDDVEESIPDPRVLRFRKRVAPMEAEFRAALDEAGCKPFLCSLLV